MLPKTAISNLINELNGRIPPPVHTAGIEDERPVPAVLIENVEIESLTYHNSTYAGSEYSAAGDEEAEVHRHYYNLRIQLLVRTADEIQAYDILGQLQQALGDLERSPQRHIHEDVNDLRTLGSGEVSYQFLEPMETEISQSLVIETFYDTTGADAEPIESISTTYEVS